MKIKIHSKFSRFAGIIPANLYIKLTGNQPLFPYYHAVSNYTPAHLRHVYSVKSVNDFTNDLNFLLKHFEPGNIEHFGHEVSGKKPFFYLSFDHGLAECYHIISPILKKKGVHATFFIKPDLLDNKNLFYKHRISLIIDKLSSERENRTLKSEIYAILGGKRNEFLSVKKLLLSVQYFQKRELDFIEQCTHVKSVKYLENVQPYLSTNQVWDLINEGFSIGVNGIACNGKITANEIIRQSQESITFLQKKFGVKHIFLAFGSLQNTSVLPFYESISQLNVKFSFCNTNIKIKRPDNNFQRILMEKSE